MQLLMETKKNRRGVQNLSRMYVFGMDATARAGGVMQAVWPQVVPKDRPFAHKMSKMRVVAVEPRWR